MTGLIPQSFIDDLLHRTDIVEVIDKRVPLKKRGNNYTACCPFHREKKRLHSALIKIANSITALAVEQVAMPLASL
ncbi:MAG: hypothetical protein CM1200mP40_26660 [Gammaproteobacteria bacterium]|nr:MAG: hypothetical protein CM1200mP40_26660 [Gammaproteobacteria bacterium]